ncbi:hypothetical protein HPB47_022532 [Ixodes persulcatus]|uniref:Uncharacterized protein n=1 Tax=Ixodes persulcatus TaxID=34615 RepID=A0AC60QBC6_IXOPE|nr:hypothetical protein HPB47_022532 [Ixodes persulcatus]
MMPSAVNDDVMHVMTALRRVVEAEETLGSDHHIVQTQVRHHKAPTRLGRQRSRIGQPSGRMRWPGSWQTSTSGPRKMTGAVIKHAKTIQLTTDDPGVDLHLFHLWEARQGLLRRWKRQKINRKLKAKIAQITSQAEEYAERLGRQNWNRNMKTWAILRALLNRAEPKATWRQQTQKLIHNFPGKNEKILEAVKTKALPHTETTREETTQSLKNPSPEFRWRLLGRADEKHGSRAGSSQQQDSQKPEWQDGRLPTKTCQRKLGDWDYSVPLQTAVYRIEPYLRDCGLACAEKSELLILKKQTKGRTRPEEPNLELMMDGVTIPKRLLEMVSQVTHVVKRVANRKNGLKEQNSMRLVQSLVVSRISYGTLHRGLQKREKKIDGLIRKTCKLALGLPPTTSTERVI